MSTSTDKFDLQGFKVTKDNVCLADGGFVGSFSDITPAGPVTIYAPLENIIKATNSGAGPALLSLSHTGIATDAGKVTTILAFIEGSGGINVSFATEDGNGGVAAFTATGDYLTLVDTGSAWAPAGSSVTVTA